MFRLSGVLLFGWVLSGIADNEGAWAGNWSKSNNQTKVPYEFIEIEGQIPLTRTYDLTPTKSDILLTDTGIYKYPNCEDSKKGNKHQYPYDRSSGVRSDTGWLWTFLFGCNFAYPFANS